MISEVKAIVRPEMLDQVLHELRAIPGVPGITVSQVRGFGRVIDSDKLAERSAEIEMAKIETVVADALVERVVATIESAARTGHHGDGRIFITPLRDTVRIRTGERGVAAL